MSFQDYLVELEYDAQTFITKIFSDAISMLKEDIENPNLNSGDNGPDEYVHRVNNIALKLLHVGHYGVWQRFLPNPAN